jgi:CBS domain-containing protein
MSTPVVSLSPHASVEECVSRLVEGGFSGAPVVDDQGGLVGLLDDSDLVLSEARLHGPTMLELLGAYIPLPWENRRFEEDVRHALGRTVGEVMHSDPPAVGTDATVENVATLMRDKNVSRVPVVDAEHEIGIVTRGDIVRSFAWGQVRRSCSGLMRRCSSW